MQLMLATLSRIKHHTPTTRWSDKQTHATPISGDDTPSPVSHTRRRSESGPVASKPTVCWQPPPHTASNDTNTRGFMNVHAPEPIHYRSRSIHRFGPGHGDPRCGPAMVSWCSLEGGDPAAPSGTATLLRLRPIADPTFDGSLPRGLGHRFGCYRLS